MICSLFDFCPKIVAGRQGCIAKKEVWRVGTAFPVSLQCYGAIHEITCHLFIYAAPGATRTN